MSRQCAHPKRPLSPANVVNNVLTSWPWPIHLSKSTLAVWYHLPVTTVGRFSSGIIVHCAGYACHWRIDFLYGAHMRICTGRSNNTMKVYINMVLYCVWVSRYIALIVMPIALTTRTRLPLDGIVVSGYNSISLIIQILFWDLSLLIS